MVMPGSIGWSVISQRQDIRANGTGQLVRGVVVAFQTNSGTTGEVFVPEAQFTADYVRQAIESKARMHDQISKLSG